MIEVQNLTKTFGKLKAVDDISFTVQEGEIFGFLGRNGAGKTVTIKMLTTQMLPTSGKVRIDGYDPITESLKVKKIVGVMPEIQNLYVRMTASENLSLFAKLYRVSQNRVRELLKMFQLEEWANKLVKTFSLGMKQRLLFARALLACPKILFLDEPTNALDPQAADFVREMIKEINRQGITIFLTTHYIEEAEMLSHRVAIIEKGKIVACDTVERLKKDTVGENYIKITYKNLEETKIPSSEISRLSEIIKGKEVSALEIEKPTLRDAFISLTGKDIK
ncbi:MAG: ABC transporter ATP-binding protein [Candidatus Edwardsbacteria bacterium]